MNWYWVVWSTYGGGVSLMHTNIYLNCDYGLDGIECEVKWGYDEYWCLMKLSVCKDIMSKWNNMYIRSMIVCALWWM